MARTNVQSSTQIQWICAGVILLLILLGFLLVVEPFLVPLAWSGILVLSTWPIFDRLQHRMPSRPGLAAFLMSILVALIFVGAITPILVSLTGEANDAFVSIRTGIADGSFHPPLDQIPRFGPRLQQQWNQSFGDRESILQTVANFQERIIAIATTAAKGVATILVIFFVVIVLSFFLYRDGHRIAAQLKRVAIHVGGQRSEQLLLSVRDTLKGAVYGILLTAFAQGLLAGIGYSVSGVPKPVLLGFTTMIFSLVPFGTPLIYLPAAGYLAANGSVLWGVILAVWGVGVVSMSDNILRPYFVSQSTQMPILLSVIGVIGGLIAFGLLGLFLGPAIVAVVLALWREWLHDM